MRAEGVEPGAGPAQRLDRATGAERIEPLLALAWKVRRSEPEQAEALVREALDLIEAYPEVGHGHASRAHAQLSRMLAYRGRGAESVEHAGEAMGLLQDDATAADRALAHLALASAELRGGSFKAARTLLEQGLELNAGLELRSLLRGVLGAILHRLGEPEAAETNLRAAIQDAEASGDASLDARSRWMLSEVLASQGRADESERLLEQALRSSRQAGDRQVEASTLRMLGSAAGRRRAHGEALAHLDQAAQLEREHGYPHGLANTLNLLGLEHLALGMHERAREILREGVDIWRSLGIKGGLGLALHYLSHAEADGGAGERALALAEESVALVRQLGDESELAGVLDGLARQRLRSDDLVGAAAAFEEQVALAESCGRADFAGMGWSGLALAHARRGDKAAAQAAIERALTLAEELDQTELRSNTHAQAVDVFETLERYELALQHHRLLRDIEVAAAQDVVRAREAAERERTASEQRLAKAFRNSPDSITITRLADGTVVEASSGFERTFGWTVQEAVGRSTLELGLWARVEDRERFREELQREGRVRGLSTVGTRKSGEQIDCEISAEVLEIDGDPCALTVARDVTERRLAERRLAESEVRYRELIAQQPNTVILYDLEDRRILDCNPAGERLLGRPRDEIIGSRPEAMAAEVLPDGRRAIDASRTIDRRMLENGTEQVFEWSWLRPDGEERITEIRLVPFGLPDSRQALASIVDRTESIRAARALAESEERYRTVVEDQTEFVVRHEPGGILTFVNDSYCRYFGRKSDALIGTSFYELIPDEAHRELVRQKFASLTPANPVSVNEHIVMAGDGSRRWNEWSDRAYFDQEGNAVAYQSVGRDVTDRRQAQDALHAALEEVKRLRDRLQEENLYLREEIRDAYDAQELVGSSPVMLAMKRTIRRVAKTDATVLISGETGTGKELVVRALHEASARRRRPLIKVNCAAVAAGLVESELFGHERGAFTGAVQQRKGRFEIADGGSLFLDEVGELSDEVQAKLLRVLEEGEFERVGSSTVIRSDVRVFAATNRDLEQEVERGHFRRDLYYRLNVFPIQVPPLRERDEDAEELAEHFLRVYRQRFGRALEGFDADALTWIRAYAWPGNVRELRNLVERAAITAEGPKLRRADFGAVPRAAAQAEAADKTLDDVQRRHIVEVLEQTGWVIQGPDGAAGILGMQASTLRSRMQRLGIVKPRRGGPG